MKKISCFYFGIVLSSTLLAADEIDSLDNITMDIMDDIQTSSPDNEVISAWPNVVEASTFEIMELHEITTIEGGVSISNPILDDDMNGDLLDDILNIDGIGQEVIDSDGQVYVLE